MRCLRRLKPAATVRIHRKHRSTQFPAVISSTEGAKQSLNVNRLLVCYLFEIANWKVQIENFIFPIFILQLFHTFFVAMTLRVRSSL
ncbi:MAG: hypothetical protein AUJ18_09010 [Candidatus Hydrogenedentes bacterium CG1_02_42_14]|nr:MAG: hypothetical protein AUJ18_09010 [Candidatus Hydrogenedentes bacterium CG1_02_42_14]